MNERKRRSDRVEVAIPIRIRGMSAQHKFFDEETETRLLSQHGVMTRLQNLVELEAEVYVTSLKNNLGGTFRVTWINTRNQEGSHEVGLETVETEGDLWEVHFPPPEPGEDEVIAQAWLACQRCRQRVLTPIPEAEYEFLREGFLIAKPCDRCRATTPWEFSTEETVTVEPEPEEATSAAPEAGKGPGKKPSQDQRGKGRAPLKMHIKVIRQKYGTTLEDVCETENISRNGALFLTAQSYDVGEQIKVVLPYKEGELTIPVPARVVRQSSVKGSFHHGVAIHLEGDKK